MSELVGTRIRQARLRKAMRQSDLAAALGVTRSAVANWESMGGPRPSLNNLARIALVTDSGFDWLATGRGVHSDELPALRDIDIVYEPDERALLQAYRSCHAAARAAVLQIVAIQAAMKS